MNKLQISPDVVLPTSAVTQTFAILAKRGAGKTNTSVVLTEEMLKANLPVVVVDPVGVWWGLRSSKDGKSAGFPVAVLGGEHGDMALQETAGTLIADFLVKNRIPTILDVSLFSKSGARRFMKDFCERLYQKNRDYLHLVLDEADSFIPQKVEHGMEPLVGAVNDIVRRGRARGLGVTLISQRPALVNKDVLTQIECLIILQMTGPQDRDAVERWVEHNADEVQAKTVLSSLQSLERGDAWIWSPSWLKYFKRTHIRERETFDSSATPEVGRQVTPPKTLAEVDLNALQQQMAFTIDEANRNDPKKLRDRVFTLEGRIRILESELVAEQQRRSPSLPGWALDSMRGVATEITQAADNLKALAGLASKAAKALDAQIEKSTEPRRILPEAPHRTPEAPKRAVSVAGPAPRGEPTAEGEPTAPQIKMLGAISQYPNGVGKVRLALLLRQAHGGGGFNNNLGRLRSLGLITKTEPIVATREAKKYGPFDVLPTGPELLEHWYRKLGKCERVILQELVCIYPKNLSKEVLADRTGYTADGGGFNNALGRLRTLELITDDKKFPGAREELFV